MKKSLCIFLCFLSFCSTLEAQFIEEIKLNFKFNADQCNYTCNLLIIEGSTSTISISRQQANSLISFDIPSSSSIEIIEEYNPLLDNLLNLGTVPMTWNIMNSNNIPNGFPYDRKIIDITPSLGQNAHYNDLLPGDTVQLFDFEFNHNFIADNLNIHLAGFTIGSLTQLYTGSTYDDFPMVFANVTGLDSIAIGETTMVAPTTGGTWSTNTDTIATIDHSGLVTGTGDGFAILTYTPDNGDCPTSTIVKIGDTFEGDDPVDPPPSPEGDPSVAAYIDGDGAQGIIIPRISFAQRLAIENPPIGLLLFQYDESSGFYYFDQGVWKKL